MENSSRCFIDQIFWFTSASYTASAVRNLLSWTVYPPGSIILNQILQIEILSTRCASCQVLVKTIFICAIFVLSVLAIGMEKAMAPHSSTLAWKIPWMEEPGRL